MVISMDDYQMPQSVITPLNPGLYWRTCDQCSEGPRICLIVDGEYYICEECQARHERALDAAMDAVVAAGILHNISNYNLNVVVATAVKAYNEYTDEDT